MSIATSLSSIFTGGGSAWGAVLAGGLIVYGLIKLYLRERAFDTLGIAITQLIETIDKAPTSTSIDIPTDKLRTLLEETERDNDAAWIDANRALLSRLESTIRSLRQMSTEWEEIFDAVDDGIVILDRDRRIVRINRAASKMLQLNRDSSIGMLCCGSIHREGCDMENCTARQSLAAGKGVRGELSPLGDEILEVFTSPLVDLGGIPFGSVHLLRDIGKQLNATRQASEILLTDTLTGLPNRSRFRTELHRAMETTRLNGSELAILLVDLDGFATINDGLGHLLGDQLLIACAQRLKDHLPKGTMLGRLGGDEFALFLSHTPPGDALEIAQSLLAACSNPFLLGDQTIFCTVSIGIAFRDPDTDDASILLKQADVAMYHAKQHGRNTYRVYTSKMDTKALERLRLGTSLRHALDRFEFDLHYQPRFDLKNGAMTGMEALLRWSNHEFGPVPPSRFIPLAEENGMILPIGRWVLHTACRQVKLWSEQGLNPPRVAVNISALQLKCDDIVETVAEILELTGLPADLLELELTETVLMSDTQASIAKLYALKSLGVHIALDDFGTGYSSLNYLKNFPLDHIKIDRSFIHDLHNNPDDASIVEVIISIAHTLGLNVIAEGIETEEQLAFLIEHNCDEVQGFFYSPPVPAAVVSTYFSNTRDQQRQIVAA